MLENMNHDVEFIKRFTQIVIILYFVNMTDNRFCKVFDLNKTQQ